MDWIYSVYNILYMTEGDDMLSHLLIKSHNYPNILWVPFPEFLFSNIQYVVFFFQCLEMFEQIAEFSNTT